MSNQVKLSQEQKAQIYCVKHGHAKYVTAFMGYVHCGRCGQQIGDSLGGIFDFDGYAVVGHDCPKCDYAKSKLSDFDKEIMRRLEENDSVGMDCEKILKGIDFGEE
jgi:hypothetical protein